MAQKTTLHVGDSLLAVELVVQVWLQLSREDVCGVHVPGHSLHAAGVLGHPDLGGEGVVGAELRGFVVCPRQRVAADRGVQPVSVHTCSRRQLEH